MRISQKPVGQLGCVECEPRVSDRRVPGAWDRKVSDDVLTLTCADFPSLCSSHSWVWIPGEGWGVNLLFLPCRQEFPFPDLLSSSPRQRSLNVESRSSAPSLLHLTSQDLM